MWTTNAQMETRQNRPPRPQRLRPLGNHHMSRHSQFCSCTLKMTLRRRCERCIHLDVRGSMHLLREHQQVLDVMVNVGRKALRPYWVFTNLGRKNWNNWHDLFVHIKKGIERTHRNLGHPSVQQMEKLFWKQGKRRSD